MIQHAPPSSALVAFDTWLAELNKTRITGFRWRRDGLIETVNIHGRLYVTRESIAAFERRAIAGEFSKPHATPQREASR